LRSAALNLGCITLTPRIGTQVKIDKETLLRGDHAGAMRVARATPVLLFRGIVFDDEQEIAAAA
jgi:hypothetical protein